MGRNNNKEEEGTEVWWSLLDLVDLLIHQDLFAEIIPRLVMGCGKE